MPGQKKRKEGNKDLSFIHTCAIFSVVMVAIVKGSVEQHGLLPSKEGVEDWKRAGRGEFLHSLR